jgi:hypothetical protein
MTIEAIGIHAPHSGELIYIDPGNFTQLCLAIHKFNTQWWLDPKTGEKKDRNVGEMLMLMVSELSEALEAHRKNLQDDKLPQFHGIDVELIDCIIRAMDLLGARYAARLSDPLHNASNNNAPAGPAYSPGDVFGAKCIYNANRPDHRPAARLAPGGKTY